MVATAGVSDYEWWKYFIVPFMSGAVGWGTNVLALHMTFYPLEFFGINLFRPKGQPWGFFGWQGIVPTKVEKMAGVTFDLMTTKLIDIGEMFNKLDPNIFADVMKDGLLLIVDSTIDEIARKHMPTVWDALPHDVKNGIIVSAAEECPEFLAGFMIDMQKHIFDVWDAKAMSIQTCVDNKSLFNEMFLECGEKEFAFIRISGFYFGFLFGCVQMAILFFFTKSWFMPICGFIVGWFTNYLALKVIFRPLVPVKIGPFTIHGLFFTRQNEVSETFARVITAEILHTSAIWNDILHGKKQKFFHAILRMHSILFTDKLVGGFKTIAVAAMGTDQFCIMKEDIATKIIEKLPDSIDQSFKYTTQALDIENTMRDKLKELSCAEFEAVLHPAFEEDEITLIFLGGVLGSLVGVAQMYIFSN